jgi:hypothetical protein
MFAGLVWLIGASVLGFRAVGWFAEAPQSLALVALAAVLGVLKARYVLEPVARGAIERIRQRGAEACAGGFLSVRSWVLVILMIAAGHALRLTAIPRPTLAVVYATVAIALLLASRLYWQAARS